MGKPKCHGVNTAEDSLPLRVLSFNVLAQKFSRGTADGVVLPEPELGSSNTVPDGLALVKGKESPSGSSCSVSGPEGSAASDGQEQTFRCSQSVLEWRLRWPKIRSLILQHNVDLIALQELDLHEDGVWPEVRQDLLAAGYFGRKAKKLGEAGDGVALFWRSRRLRPVGRAEIWRLQQKSVHIALAQRLQLDDRLEFWAITSHLKAGLSQSAEFERLAQISAIRRQIGNCEPRAPVLVLADLNSHCRALNGNDGVSISPHVYDYITQHGFRSLVKDAIGMEMQFTCWGGWQNFDVAGVFDYVLSYEDHLEGTGSVIEGLRALMPPQPRIVRQYSERLPNKDHPSDHIPVVVELRFTAVGQGSLPHDAEYTFDETEEELPLVLLEPEAPEMEKQIDVPKQLLGRVIGKQGQMIKSIRERSGAKLDVWDQSGDPCQLKLEGTIEQVRKASDIISELVEVGGGSVSSTASPCAASPVGGRLKEEVVLRLACQALLTSKQAHLTVAQAPRPLVGVGSRSNFKTQLCNYFEQGHCSRGAFCSYAHGLHDLATAQQAEPPAPIGHSNLYVSNLPAGIDQATFQAIFAAHGQVMSCHLESDRRYGFVKYATLREAESAISTLGGFEYVKDMRLTVRYAKNTYDTAQASIVSAETSKEEVDLLARTAYPPSLEQAKQKVATQPGDMPIADEPREGGAEMARSMDVFKRLLAQN